MDRVTSGGQLVMRRLVAVLVDGVDEADLLRAAEELHALATQDGSAQALVEAGLLRPLVNLLSATGRSEVGDEVKVYCASMLTHILPGSAEIKVAAGEAGVVSALVSLLQRESSESSEELKTVSCLALRSMFLDADIQAAARREGALDVLVALLCDREASDRLKTQGAGALGNVTLGNPENKVAAGAAGAIHVLVQRLQSGTSSVELKIACAETLKNVLANSAENQAAAGAAGAFDALVGLLRARESSDELKMACSRALYSAMSDHQANKTIAVAVGAVPLLRLLSQEKSGLLRQECADALKIIEGHTATYLPTSAPSPSPLEAADHLNILVGMFPSLGIGTCLDELHAADGDIDKAAESLLSVAASTGSSEATSRASEHDHASGKMEMSSSSAGIMDRPHCVVCLDRIGADDIISLVPCGHSQICSDCYYLLDTQASPRKPECPICKQVIESKMRIYF